MALKTYFDFAEDDYKYFMDSYNSGLVANSMGQMRRGFAKNI